MKASKAKENDKGSTMVIRSTLTRAAVTEGGRGTEEEKETRANNTRKETEGKQN